MKKIFFLLAITIFTTGNSQILEPVKWSTSVEKISSTEYKLITKAIIESGWHLYSQKVPEFGPIPTTFNYYNSKSIINFIDTTSEEEGYTIDDPVFGMKIKFFKDNTTFEQKIKVSESIDIINGSVEFMVCDDSRCLPPTKTDLTFNFQKDLNKRNLNPKNGILKPVKWKTSVLKISDLEYDLVIKADIDNGWHVYSQYTQEGGALPLLIEKANETDNYVLVGKAKESDTVKAFNETFKVYESYFDKTLALSQRIKLNSANTSKVSLNLAGQVCKKVCLPIYETFTFSLNKADLGVLNSQTITPDINNDIVNNKLYGFNPKDIKAPDTKCETGASSTPLEDQVEGKSLWRIFGLGFLGGLLALLTPCVFPMIPLTVSFFTKSSGQNRNAGISKALLYGFFIFAVYILLSLPFHLIDSVNPDILNEISTNVWLNVVFFVIFLFFAFSFFGYYELTLPSSWTTRTTQGETSGGLIGIFFMALTLAIVSFSCTGPILGSLLAGSLTADGGAWQLTAGMAGFGVSLGLPFALFATFPNMMSALPKSGGWLNTTKVILGFLELALAFKFLSNADLVAHWNVLKIEPFLIIWIIIFVGLALYLFGKLKFPHDSQIKKLSFFRIAGGILIVSFAMYLASGFRVNKETNTFTPLTLLSGLAPPVGYSFLYPNACPNNLKCFKDLKTGIAYAKKVNKPIMLDFTGYACVNCRKMEEHVWPLKSIDKYLRNDYVLISLYVDDKRELPKAEQIEVNKVNGGTRKLKSYGHKWANFQTQFFKTNAQPYYVLLNSEGTKILNQAIGYTPNENDYLQFLECGLTVFKDR